MFDTDKARLEFTNLTHNQKIAKTKEILAIMSKKSDIFADLHKHFQNQKDIADNVMDYIYGIVMNMVENKQTK